MLRLLYTAFTVLLITSVGDAGSKNNNESPNQQVQQHKVNNNLTTQSPITTHSVPMNFAKNDLLYLSELPLEQLLKVKKSIDEIQQVSRHADTNDDDDQHHPIGVVEELKSTEDAVLESRIINDYNLENEKGQLNNPLPLVTNHQQQQQQLQQNTQLPINR